MKKLGVKIACFLLISLCSLAVFFLPGVKIASANSAEDFAEPQSITYTYNGKTWHFNLRDYEVHSKIFTIEYMGGRFNRHGSASQKMESIAKLVKNGMTYSEAFNFIIRGIDADIIKMLSGINKKTKDATIKFSPKTEKFTITSESLGYYINKEELLQQTFLALQNQSEVTIKLKPEVLKPKYYSDNFKKAIYKRESFTTSFPASTEARRHNIKTATKKLNGLTLMPGEVLSFNQLTGKRTKQNGYRDANIILNGIYTAGEAGGVCQVSTALFNSAVLNGLEILEVRSHSLLPSYAELGEDAMVSEGISDLKIKNSFKTPLSIKATVTGDNLTITMFGEKPNGTSYKLETFILEELPEKEREILVDKEGKYAKHFENGNTKYLARKATEGYKTETYLLTYKNDELVSRKRLRKDTYKPQGELVVVKP